MQNSDLAASVIVVGFMTSCLVFGFMLIGIVAG